jgi:hypothetical protein
MRQDAGAPVRRLPAPVRRIVARFAAVVCPPGAREWEPEDGLLDEFEALLGVLSPVLRWSVLSALVAFDQGARFYPRARGRRFTRLGDADAGAYVRAALAVRRGGLGVALQRIKGLIVFCYYELPEVKQQLGYRPDPYIAAVSRRRLASYGAQIRAAEAAVLAVGVDAPGAGTGLDPGTDAS